jgi:hypothetical protein
MTIIPTTEEGTGSLDHTLRGFGMLSVTRHANGAGNAVESAAIKPVLPSNNLLPITYRPTIAQGVHTSATI